MTTERELQDALDRRDQVTIVGGGGSDGSDDGGDAADGGGRRLTGFLEDLDAALGEFARDLRQVPYALEINGKKVFDTGLRGPSLLGANLAETDTRPKVRALIRDLDANYLLREPALAAHGLTGDPLLYKTSAAERRRKSLREELEELAQRFRGWQRYFNVAATIFDSLYAALKEIPGMSALIDAIKEILEFLAFNAEEIAERY